MSVESGVGKASDSEPVVPVLGLGFRVNVMNKKSATQ